MSDRFLPEQVQLPRAHDLARSGLRRGERMKRVEIVPAGRSGNMARVEVYVDTRRTWLSPLLSPAKAREEARRVAGATPITDHTA